MSEGKKRDRDRDRTEQPIWIDNGFYLKAIAMKCAHQITNQSYINFSNFKI